jgi:hypothetical protein
MLRHAGEQQFLLTGVFSCAAARRSYKGPIERPIRDMRLSYVRIPMMVMGDSDLIVMVVSERNDHHDRSEATLTL